MKNKNRLRRDERKQKRTGVNGVNSSLYGRDLFTSRTLSLIVPSPFLSKAWNVPAKRPHTDQTVALSMEAAEGRTAHNNGRNGANGMA